MRRTGKETKKQDGSHTSEDQQESQKQIRDPGPGELISQAISSQDRSEAMQKLLSSSQFSWSNKYQSSLVIHIIETDFESMSVLLHYGNFQMKIITIFTNFDEKLLNSLTLQSGTFGVVRFCHFQNEDYAIKSIKIKEKDNDLDLGAIYREYFLYCVADILGVGPKMLKLFGYDIVVSRSMAFFSMENCAPVAEESVQTIGTQLFQAIKTLHSLNIVHKDIKPGNIAYSRKAGKHVMIDFGLSRMIAQLPGQKTRTWFSGTLCFCSEQMKSCWILGKQMPVDLYQNDLCCLKKSIQRIQLAKCAENSCDKDSFNIFQSLALALRLKFFLAKENPEKVSEVMKNSDQIPNCIYQIWLNTSVSLKVSSNLQIREKMEEIRNHIYNSSGQCSFTDKYLCKIFCQEGTAFSAQKIIPISQLLQLQQKSFNVLLERVQIVYKLFLFFDPFSSKVTKSSTNLHLKEKIIAKIFKMRTSNQNESCFHCKKIRLVLIFFYDWLIELKNIKVMTSLRMLFISVEDWDYVEKLEDQIICSTDSPRLKMLRIAEFSLFWDLLFQDFDHKRKEKWRQIVTETEATEATQKKVKELCELLMVDNKYFSYSEEFKNSAIVKILELGNHFSEKECLYNITYMYSEITKIHFSLFTSAPRGLTLRIYSRFFILFTIEISKAEQIEQKMLLPMRLQFWREFRLTESQTLVSNIIHRHFQNYQKRNQYSCYKFLQLIKFGLKFKGSLAHFLQAIVNINWGLYETDFDIFNRLRLFQFSLKMLLVNKKHPIKEERFSKQERQQFQEQIQQSFKNLIKGQGVKQALSSSKKLRISRLILETSLSIRKHEQANTKLLITQTFNELCPLPYEHPNIVIYFMKVFQHLQATELARTQHFSRDIMVHIAESYISRGYFYIFQEVPPLLGFYFRIKNERADTDRLALILSFLEHFRKRKYFFSVDQFNNNALIYAVQGLVKTFSFHQIQEVYQQMKFNKLEWTCGFYGYLVFYFFLSIHETLELNVKRAQIVRSTFSLSKMPPLCRQKTIPYLLSFAKSFEIVRSKRKLLICCRLEGKILDSEYVKDLKCRYFQKQIKSRASTKAVHEKTFLKLKRHHYEITSSQ